MSKPFTSSTTIQNIKGLHARASAKFVKCATMYEAEVTVCCNNQCADALSIMDLMMLGAHKGLQITLQAHGPQAEEAATALIALIDDKFGEES